MMFMSGVSKQGIPGKSAETSFKISRVFYLGEVISY